MPSHIFTDGKFPTVVRCRRTGVRLRHARIAREQVGFVDTIVAENREPSMIGILFVYVGAAIAEIGGCFGFWMWLRQDKSAWLLPASLASLSIFAWLLTLVDTNVAGRAFAAYYGGVYIVASLVWLWQVEHVRPDSWDIVGGAVCLVGAAHHSVRSTNGCVSRPPSSPSCVPVLRPEAQSLARPVAAKRKSSPN